MENIDPSVLQAFFDFVIDIIPIHDGLINRTFKIVTKEKNYLLQKLNVNIFKDSFGLQSNYRTVRDTLLEKQSFVLPDIIQTKTNENLFVIDDEYWRCFEFYDHAYSPSAIQDESQLISLANAFGSFTNQLNCISANALVVTIPNFHHLAYRFFCFQDAIDSASKERRDRAQGLIDDILADQKPLKLFLHIQGNPKLFPLHILHHDCKISNILFDKNDHSVICPIDIDTTMPGYFFSDLGDMLRNLSSDLKEDDANFEVMKLRVSVIQTLTETYTAAVKESFTDTEIKLLPYSGHILTYMQCIRFLTDFLNNDQYYTTEYPMHNHVRAQNQWKLYSLMNEYLPLENVDFSV